MSGLQIVWFGEWCSDLDGIKECRASVAVLGSKYLPGLEVSYRGGNCEPIYGEGCSTLEQAHNEAKRREANWHMED